MKVKFTKHAEEMLLFRKIKKEQVVAAIEKPDDKSKGESDKKVLYKDFGENYLKVVIVKEKNEVVVITEHWIAKKRVKK